MTTKKQGTSAKNGYSTKEARDTIDKYIDESAERLQKKLRTAWKMQYSVSKKLSYAKNPF